MRFERRGLTTHKSATRLTVLQKKKAINLHSFWFEMFRAKEKLLSNPLYAGLFVRDDGSKNERLDGPNKLCALLAKTLASG